MVMKNRCLLLAAIAAAAILFDVGDARAVGECRAQSPGVPGPSYVYFAVGSSKIDAAAKQEIKEVADRVKALYIRTVCLLGSADKQGNERSNFALSVKRAEAVAAALEREGVAAKYITVVGKGETYGDWLKVFEDNQQDRSVKITLTK
jgi:outer membrane protein OmpA-like peptidoglycan-associated protein